MEPIESSETSVYNNTLTPGTYPKEKKLQLTPADVNIRVHGNNPRCQRTKNAAILYRTNQELKFQYAKKQKLNENRFPLNLCTGRPLTESDDTRWCINTIQPPDDEHIILETCRGL